MRHNIPQAVIGEQLDVSQPTVSRAIKVMTGAIILALKDLLLTAEEVPEGCDYVVDGTLFPCWSWRNHRELWSGKHKTTGMNASDPGPAQRQARVGLGPLSGVHARRGRPVAKIQRDDFRSRYLNFFEVTKDSNASQVFSKNALCLLLMEFLPSFQTFSMGFLSGL